MPRKREGSNSWVDGKAENYYEDVYNLVEDDETFHIGQSYDDEAATTVECAKCHGRVFNVGMGDYFTAIRCVKCEWETCIHDG